MEGFVENVSLSFLFGKICRFVICIESSSDFQTKQFSNKFACNIRQSSEKRTTTDKCIDLSVGQLQTKSISMPSNAAYFLFEASIRNTFSKVLYFLKRYFLKISWKYIFFLLFFLQRQKQLYHSWPKGQQRMWKEVTTLYIFLPVHILPINVYSTTQHTSATDLYVGIYVIYMWGALLWPHCGGCWH